MCIRDRFYVNTLRSIPLVMVILWFFLLIPLLIGRPMGAEPVSYTHLRAHETVLDLVCRLLLEKKKNRQGTDAYHLCAAVTHNPSHTRHLGRMRWQLPPA